MFHNTDCEYSSNFIICKIYIPLHSFPFKAPIFCFQPFYVPNQAQRILGIRELILRSIISLIYSLFVTRTHQYFLSEIFPFIILEMPSGNTAFTIMENALKLNFHSNCNVLSNDDDLPVISAKCLSCRILFLHIHALIAHHIVLL